MLRTIRYLVPLFLIFWMTAGVAFGAVYYVDATGGNDANPGTAPESALRTVAKVNAQSFQPADAVLFKRGDRWAESLRVNSSGTAASPLTFGAYGEAEAPVIQGLWIGGGGDFTVFEDLVIDHARQDSDAVIIRGAENCLLRRMTVRNGTRDGVDLDSAHGLVIDSCRIHHFLGGSFEAQFDAHGIVATDSRGITIRNTEIHHVSGDSFQTDPDRDSNYPDEILIENCHFWTSPLESDFQVLDPATAMPRMIQTSTGTRPVSDWQAGERPGENAIDTKVEDIGWESDSVPRMRITLRNVIAHGWLKDNFISNKAAFNMKEKIEAVFDGVTVYDCELAFRLRGTRGNANTTIQNAVIYNCEKAIRAEDNLANLKVYHGTFGELLPVTGATPITVVAGSKGVATWDLRNNAFLGIKPLQATSPSNILAPPEEFLSVSNRDYHLSAREGSLLIDRGDPTVPVTIDRDRVVRPQAGAPDIGAYELVPNQPLRGDINQDGRVNLRDAIQLLRKIAGQPVPIDEAAADINRDGRLTLSDFICLLRGIMAGGTLPC